MSAVLTDVYTRLSRDRDDQTSTQRQALDCRRLAESKGWTVAMVHEDVDFSAYRTGVRRPAYEQLIERVKRRDVDAVVVWKIDRLARSLKEFLRFADLCEHHGVALVSVHEPFDTSSPIGRAIMQVLAVFAELESATIGIRVKSAREWAANTGKPRPGGRRMFGYEPDMSIRESEAAAIRDAAERVLRGEGYPTVAKRWNELGLTTSGGNPWTARTAARTLRSPHLAGQRVHRGEVVGTGAWEPILDLETHQALVAGQRQGRKQPPRRTYLLTGGILRCGACGTEMRGKFNRGRRTYQCSLDAFGCGRVSIAAEATERYVEEQLFAVLKDPDVVAALSAVEHDNHETRDLLDALQGVNVRLTELGQDYAAGLVPRAAFLAAARDLEAEMTRLRVALDAIDGKPVLSGADPIAEWRDRDVTWRNQLIAAVFEQIVIAPAGKGGPFDSNRIKIVDVS